MMNIVKLQGTDGSVETNDQIIQIIFIALC